MLTPELHHAEFETLLLQILQARENVYQHANVTLIDLYWQLGKTISAKVRSKAWGQGVVSELALYLAQKAPDIKGFSDKNLWRMKQFFETYEGDSILSPLVREIPWTQNMVIFSRCKNAAEREFYLKLCISEKYSKRTLERQIDSSMFERLAAGTPQFSQALAEHDPNKLLHIKNTYVLEFLGLPEVHTESDLQRSMVQNMKKIIQELGPDYIFIQDEYKLQVGNQDFYIDLLFFHRGLAALIAFELKIGKFMPEHLGQLSFYLEALDRDVKKPHENPSIGILLCRDKDNEVVEYALSRNLSPAMVAEYSLKLPDKKLLGAQLNRALEQHDKD